MAIEAVKIPQNVYVEDRIIGPITLKQLIITGIGAGISYVIFSIVTRAGLTVPFRIVAWVPAMIAAAFAFFKINDLSLFTIILLAIEKANKPSQRYWRPHAGISINLIVGQAAKEIADAHAHMTKNAERLIDITRQMQDRQEEMNHLAIHEAPRPSDSEPTLLTPYIKDEGQNIAITTPHAALAEDTSPLFHTNDVQSTQLDPKRSIDGIGKRHSLQTFS